MPFRLTVGLPYPDITTLLQDLYAKQVTPKTPNLVRVLRFLRWWGLTLSVSLPRSRRQGVIVAKDRIDRDEEDCHCLYLPAGFISPWAYAL